MSVDVDNLRWDTTCTEFGTASETAWDRLSLHPDPDPAMTDKELRDLVKALSDVELAACKLRLMAQIRTGRKVIA